MQVAVVSPPRRNRDNLLTMLESIDLLDSIKTAETCDDVINTVDSINPATVMIDYRYPDTGMEKEVGKLIMNDGVNHIVLLQTRNAPRTHFTHYTTSEVVFDELSVGILNNLLKNIYLETAV